MIAVVIVVRSRSSCSSRPRADPGRLCLWFCVQELQHGEHEEVICRGCASIIHPRWFRSSSDSSISISRVPSIKYNKSVYYIMNEYSILCNYIIYNYINI